MSNDGKHIRHIKVPVRPAGKWFQLEWKSVANQWLVSGESMGGQWRINGWSVTNQWLVSSESMENRWDSVENQ